MLPQRRIRYGCRDVGSHSEQSTRRHEVVEEEKTAVKEQEKVAEVEEKIEEKIETDQHSEQKTKDEAVKKPESTPVGRRRTEEFGDPVGNYNKVEKPKEPIKEEPTVSDVDEAGTSRSAFDLFSSNAEETIADKLSKKDDATVAGKIGQSQIADLRQAIGINEKFLFINELFNGDLGRYNKAIDEFNSLENQQGVDTYLLEMKIQNQWPDDGEAYIKLKALLDRKFG